MPDLTHLLQTAREFGEWPETEKWLRWRDRIDWSCTDPKTGANIPCTDCEHGPSCDGSNDEPHAIELLAAVVEREWMLRLAAKEHFSQLGIDEDDWTSRRGRRQARDEWLADLRARADREVNTVQGDDEPRSNQSVLPPLDPDIDRIVREGLIRLDVESRDDEACGHTYHEECVPRFWACGCPLGSERCAYQQKRDTIKPTDQTGDRHAR